MDVVDDKANKVFYNDYADTTLTARTSTRNFSNLELNKPKTEKFAKQFCLLVF